MIVGALGVVEVSVGENFRFGHRAQGDVALLRSDDRFSTTVHPLLEVDGEVVSSSHIRGLVAAGDVQRANRMLGAPFRLRGEVVHGDISGRELGFPTANMIPDERIVCPSHGVYAALADGRAAAVNIGVRPTFETGRVELIEVYIMDFAGDLYGQVLEVEFLERMRGRAAITLREREHDPEQMNWMSACRDEIAPGAEDLPAFFRRTAGRATRAKARHHGPVRGERERYGQHEGPGGAAHGADQRSHGTPAQAGRGPPLEARPVDARGPAQALFELHAAHRPRGATARLIKESSGCASNTGRPQFFWETSRPTAPGWPRCRSPSAGPGTVRERRPEGGPLSLCAFG